MLEQPQADRLGSRQLRELDQHLSLRRDLRQLLHPWLYLVRPDAQVALLSYFEQSTISNAYNFGLATWCPDNYTIHGTGLTTLWCPSDASVEKIRTLTAVAGGYSPPQQTPPGLPIRQAMTNYVPCVGMWGLPYDPWTAIPGWPPPTILGARMPWVVASAR